MTWLEITWHPKIRWHTKWSPNMQRSCDILSDHLTEIMWDTPEITWSTFKGVHHLLKELFCDEELDPDSSKREGRCRGLAVCERREDERTGEEGRISMNSFGGVILRPVTLSFLLSLRTILPCDCDCVGMGGKRKGEGGGRGRGRGEIYK